MKIGDKYKIHCYKHNGKIYQASEEAVILDILEDYIVCGNYMVTVTENDGRSYQTKELAIIYFYKHNWFNVIAQLKKYGLFYYCNIATPYVLDGNVIKYIDYDLNFAFFISKSFSSSVILFPKSSDTFINNTIIKQNLKIYKVRVFS